MIRIHAIHGSSRIIQPMADVAGLACSCTMTVPNIYIGQTSFPLPTYWNAEKSSKESK